MDGVYSVSAAARKRELEAFWSDETNLGIRDDPELEHAVFPDGSPWALCSSHAKAVRQHEGGKRAGFWADKNPDSAISRICDGHDFTIVDDRFIVDPWVLHVEQLSDRCVFDLQDPADAAEIRRLYGDPRSWESTGD
jgi:hypothetical protein